MLVTDNRKSMPVHVAAHSMAGGHHWGVLKLRPGGNWRQILEDLILIWEASEAEEWIDREEWIPFR